MIESRDPKTGIIRHEIGTVSPQLCRKDIEASGCVKHRFEGNNVVRYVAEYKGVPIEITSTPTRVILFSPGKIALEAFEGKLDIDSWEYENSTKLDYVTGH